MLAQPLHRFAGDPSALGLAAVVGDRAVDTTTGNIWVKKDVLDTDWIIGTSAYGGGGGGGASTADAFVTLGHPGDLTAERALTNSATIDVTDGGPNSTVTVSMNTAGAAAALAGTFDALGAAAAKVASVTGTPPIVSSGGLNPAISITDFVASGAGHARGSVPDPGAGAGTTKFLREDATWQVPPSGSGNGVEATVDFGSASDYATVTVTGQAWVTGTSKIVASLFGNTADHDEEDALLEEVEVLITNRVVGTGFDVHAFAPNGTFGTYKVHCVGV